MPNPVNVALISDGNDVTGACNTIQSALLKSDAVAIHVIDMGLSEAQATQLRRLSPRLQVVAVAPALRAWLEYFSPHGFPHVSRAAYTKLLLHRLLPDIDKLIYLDTDTVILADLADLFAIDLGTDFLGATWTRTQVDAGRLRLGLGQRYFNSGVMLCNLKMWRDETVESQFVEWYEMNRSRMKFNDQEILNGVFDGRNLEIGKRWNVAQAEVFGAMPPIAVKVKDIAILHFNGARKYWHADYESGVVRNFELFSKIRQLLAETSAVG
ncbi:hypothetical protein GTP91_03220 [Rugamonas sp. FT82W]|uniref:Glycosyltransferase family 8 protein n=1 Tax=Duganella vulcania TaxID=2692166 RepID=A0A845FZJ2_9BURK|nr:glycosyltransferase family 8 protein [Duganella vulcania]MYM86187.1 hypothetical protein [Duganella vulcania]